MNRDERRTRAPGLPPRQTLRSGVTVLSPVDGDAQGTWISVNHFGHTLALLNRYEDSPHDPAGSYVSRGRLVSDLAPLPGPQATDATLGSLDLSAYRPFTLASIAPDLPTHLFDWNGAELIRSSVSTPGLIRASSGSDQAAAEQARQEVFREAECRFGGLTGEIIRDLHRSHLPARGAKSICMHRDETVTVSCSLVTVSKSEMSFLYISGSPCESSEFHLANMARSTTQSTT